MQWLERWDTRRRVTVAASIVAGLVLLTGIGLAVTGGGEAPDVAASGTRPEVATTRPTTTTTTPSTSTTPVSAVSTSTSSTTTSSTSTSTTTTTIDPALLLPTLSEGDEGPEVVLLQRMLNHAVGSRLVPDGVYGPDTTEAVRSFQALFELPVTGDADHATRQLLRYVDGGQSTALPAWPVPTIGNGGADGCQVTVVGDSLMAGATAMHERALRAINCASAVDGEGGRSLNYGWQCRVFRPGGGAPLLLLPEPEPGNDTCAPSGLTLLDIWAQGQALGDIVVVALGTNDAGLNSESQWQSHWNEALRLTGDRPVIFLTTKARAGSTRTAQQDAYSAALRAWCPTQPRCFLADWALTDAANDPGSYVDSVHLRTAATQARADFIAAAVRALFAGDPIPNPQPLPTTTTSTTTTSTTSTTTTSTVPTSSSTTSTTAPSTTTTSTSTSTTSTSTTSSSTTSTTTSSSTSTTQPTSSTTSTTAAP